jgi:hypothetical protein
MPMLNLGPGRQDFTFRAGNTFTTEVDWSIDLSGYAVTSELVSLVTGAKVMDITTTLTDAASGKVGMAFAAVTVPGTYGWAQTWVAPNGDTRTGLRGYVEVTR